jgi:hypothetical protein
MMTRWTLLSTIAVLVLGGSASHLFSQDTGGEKKAKEPALAGPAPDAMKAWMESMTPGEPHKKLELQAGEYTVKGRTWMDSSAPPVDLNGTATIKMILGGRYQVREFKGDSMGMPYEGTGIAGYDNVSKEYFSTWVDNMRTGIVYYRGKSDDKGVVTMTCEIDDPLNPTVKRKSREVVKFTDQDHFSSETWMKDPKHAVGFKAAEMSYTRKK